MHKTLSYGHTLPVIGNGRQMDRKCAKYNFTGGQTRLLVLGVQNKEKYNRFSGQGNGDYLIITNDLLVIFLRSLHSRYKTRILLRSDFDFDLI